MHKQSRELECDLKRLSCSPRYFPTAVPAEESPFREEGRPPRRTRDVLQFAFKTFDVTLTRGRRALHIV